MNKERPKDERLDERDSLKETTNLMQELKEGVRQIPGLDNDNQFFNRVQTGELLFDKRKVTNGDYVYDVFYGISDIGGKTEVINVAKSLLNRDRHDWNREVVGVAVDLTGTNPDLNDCSYLYEQPAKNERIAIVSTPDAIPRIKNFRANLPTKKGQTPTPPQQ